MPASTIEESLARMPDHELVRALTIDRSEYTLEFLDAAAASLARRDVDLEALRTHAQVETSDALPAMLDMEALERAFRHYLSAIGHCLQAR